MKLAYLKHTASIAALFIAMAAHAESFNIPGGDLKSALDAYARQTGVNLIVAGAEVTGVRTRGAQGEFSADRRAVPHPFGHGLFHSSPRLGRHRRHTR